MNNSSWWSVIHEFMLHLLGRLETYLPRILLSMVLLLAGWLIAKGLKKWLLHLLSRGFERYFKDPSTRKQLDRIGISTIVPNFTGHLIFWTVFLFFFTAAIETMGLPIVTSLLSAIAVYLPNVVAGTAIVVVGVLGAILARTAVVSVLSRAQVAQADLMGRIVQATILFVAIVTGIDQIGIDSTFLIIVMGTAFGIALGAGALAFGFGARLEVSNLLASYYLGKNFKVGQRVKIEETEGKILEISSTVVVLEGLQGRIVIPSKKFSEVATMIIEGEE